LLGLAVGFCARFIFAERFSGSAEYFYEEREEHQLGKKLNKVGEGARGKKTE
jgi:hypothetical protein